MRQYNDVAEAPGNILVKFGFVTDLHMALGVRGDRYLEDADEKLADAVAVFNADASLDFIMMCGDYIDGYDGTDETQALADLAQIEAVYSQLNAPRYYVFGNHDMSDITKVQFIANTGMTEAYYSFDVGSLHCVVLDSCYVANSNDSPYTPPEESFITQGIWVSPAQLAWLERDLAATIYETIVFVHMRIDGPSPDNILRGYRVFNADDVRAILVRSGKVRHVFTGHEHDNIHMTINDIGYHVFEAMTENDYPANAYSIITIYDNGWMSVDGNGSRQETYSMGVRIPV